MRSLAFILAMVLATPAIAQQADGNANNGGNNGANSTSGTSQATNVVNVQAVTGPQTNVPQKQDVNYSGHTYTTPSVGGSYFAGANPCLVGTGLGAAGGPVGFNINIGKNDQDCTRRSDAAAWFALGLSGVAVTRLCQDRDRRNPVNADAFYAATGFACPGSNMSGRYKLADGTLAPYASLGNQMPIRKAGQFTDPAQTPVDPAVPNPRQGNNAMAPTIPANPR
jgi:hypothetical protein